MADLLRILLVEDEPSDRLLVSTALAREFPHLKIVDAASRAALAAVLKETDLDLVITDYQLHWTTGLDVLMDVKSYRPELPVIMFTGTGTEEVAVAGMKAGLDDYILKKPQHLVRLAAAVRTSLERRREREAARQAEALSRSIFEALPLPCFRTDPSGTVIDANSALAALLGFPSPRAAVGARAADWDPSGQLAGLLASAEPARSQELALRRIDGSLAWVRAHARTVRDSRGRTLYVETLLEDRAPFKQLEEELRNLRGPRP